MTDVSPAIPYAEVIGDPIVQSKSPAIHGYWIRQLGLDADYRAAHVTAEGLADYLISRRADPAWRGCNVTMPHKQAVIPLLDRLDPLAARIGAVNTIVAEQGQLVGYNTDAAGFSNRCGPNWPSSTFSAWRGCWAPVAPPARSSPHWCGRMS